MEWAAELALSTGSAVVLAGDDVILVPDVVELEGVANGMPALSDGLRLVRCDGRSVRGYRMPAGWSA